jgi:dTDP-4-amino-4,6-dideoxygalactose transaminase
MRFVERHTVEYGILADRRDIPFASASIGPDEMEAVGRALRTAQISSGGPICERVEARLVESTGAKFALLTPDISTAIDLTFTALGVEAGDEVLMSSFASPRIANAVLARGARPVFCDVEADTLNLDPAEVESRPGRQVKLVVASHENGVAADLASLRSCIEGRECRLVEDASAGIGGTWMGRHLGTIGAAGWISFGGGMNVSAGEGAALLTDDSQCFMRARALRSPDRGIGVPADAEGVPIWNGPGAGHALCDLLAAMLEAQLLRLREITRSRRRTWQHYHEGLADLDLAVGGPLRRPHVPRHATSNSHAYTLEVPTRTLRDTLRNELAEEGIETRLLAEPLHLSAYARRVLGPQASLPRVERAAECAVQLPLFAGMSRRQAERVIDEVRRVVTNRARHRGALASHTGTRAARRGSTVPTT